MKLSSVMIAATCLFVTACGSSETTADPAEFQAACGYAMPSHETFMKMPNSRVANVNEVVKTSSGFIIKVNLMYSGVVSLPCNQTQPFQGDTSNFEVF